MATRGSWVTTTARIGLPRAVLVWSDVGDHHGEYVLDLPPSRTLTARVAQGMDLGALLALLGGDRESPGEHHPDGLGVDRAGVDPEGALDARVASATSSWGVTPAQARVLGLVVVGLNNKEIAGRLGITEATVEAHGTQLFRKSGTESRTALTAAFWNRT